MDETGAERYFPGPMQDPENAAAYGEAKERIAFVDGLMTQIDEQRRLHRLSKAELARRAGLRPEAVRRLFSASSVNPTIATIYALAKAVDAGLRLVAESATSFTSTSPTSTSPQGNCRATHRRCWHSAARESSCTHDCGRLRRVLCSVQRPRGMRGPPRSSAGRSTTAERRVVRAPAANPPFPTPPPCWRASPPIRLRRNPWRRGSGYRLRDRLELGPHLCRDRVGTARAGTDCAGSFAGSR